MSKKIPYGASSYARIQTEGYYFVDKTRFIPILEESLYPFLIRPRRMGKSVWLSLLECYYDVAKKDQFDRLFGNTWIAQNPTLECNRYLILSFDFSVIDSALNRVEGSFNREGENVIHRFLDKYKSFFSQQTFDDVHARNTLSDKLAVLLGYARLQGLKLYVLIDEYDNFANTILSTLGTEAYKDLTQGTGFYRHFFNNLKAGTGKDNAPIARLFITGVSPVTMDDVTSGFNIGDNLSLSPTFQEILGFTEVEVIEMLRYYQDENLLVGDIEEHIKVMQVWYNHYRFAEDVTVSIYNTDMVLYYLRSVVRDKCLPKSMLDYNIKIDYNKLRHLILINQYSQHNQLNGNFNLLREIVQAEQMTSSVIDSFSLEQIGAPENFVSLLYYFGLLTYAGKSDLGEPVLRIPNQTVKTLMYGYLRDAFQDTNTFKIDIFNFSRLVKMMAYKGQWQSVVNFLSETIQQQTSVRDFLKAEKAIQSFLLAYLNVNDFFVSHSEAELNHGFCDILLEPFRAKYPDIPNVFLLELKCLTRRQRSSEALQLAIDRERKKAIVQLNQYAQDGSLVQRSQGLHIRKLVLIFHGWELVFSDEC